MKEKFSFFAAIISLLYLVDHFFGREEQEDIFGIDVSDPVYVLFWGVILAGCVQSVYKANKKPTNP